MIPGSLSPTKKTERLGQDQLARGMYELLYTGNIGPIPVLVHTLGAAKHKAAALLAVARALMASGQSLQSAGPVPMIEYAIDCAEPWASWRPQALSDQRGSFYYQTGLEQAQLYQYICPLIPEPPAAAVGQQQLTVSRVPMLAFNGAADPIEQPRNWAGSQKLWPSSRALALPGQGHNLQLDSWAACAGPLDQAFIEQASAAHLDTRCLAIVPAPAFDLSLPDVAGG